MTTLRQSAGGNATVPANTSWYLADLGEYRGKQERYTRQTPQRLKALRQHALVESAVPAHTRIQTVIKYIRFESIIKQDGQA